MQLLDLPTELLGLIVQQYYDPWTIYLSELTVNQDSSWHFCFKGSPAISLFTTCKQLSYLAMEEESRAFRGTVDIEENVSAMGTTLVAFKESVSTGRYSWLQTRLRTLRYSNPTMNPARWRFHPRTPTASNPGSWLDVYFPKLERIILDCRYQSLFAVHNVRNLQAFLTGTDGRLEKQIDYRQAFFLSDERFLLWNIRRGITVTVIREMGVREMDDRCQAVVCHQIRTNVIVHAKYCIQVVAIDYVRDENYQLVLDWESLKSKTAEIRGWPHNIRPTLASLDI